jgi:hypothetical protein
MADETKTLGTIGIEADGKTSVRDPVFVNLCTYKNSRYLDVRKFYQKDGEWLPSAKGVTFHAEQFTALLKILTDNQAEILEWIK